MIPTTNELDPDFIKHFNNIDNITPTSVVQSEDNKNKKTNQIKVIEHVRDMWLSKSLEDAKAYDYGVNSGRFSITSNQIKINDVFLMLIGAIKSSIENNIPKSSNGMRSYKEIFDCLISLQTILSNKIDSECAGGEKPTVSKIIATIQGHINAYVDSAYGSKK